ncbi:MAG TPA: hypothetical protein VD967_03075 [Candidatus Paceibacterota bacterium]|nr:hypothetical protein [Candidatus Paceibacterota bacterium]
MKKRHIAIRNGTLLSLALLGIGAGIYFLYPDRRAASSAEVSAVPTPYSDRHITLNAIIADPRFSDLRFFRKEKSVASVRSPLPKSELRAAPSSSENGTWLWTPLLEITPEYRASIIKGAAENGVRTIYLSLDSYLDIFVLPEGEEKEAKREAFDRALEAFIREAHAEGLSVDAEGGWRNWAESGHEYKAFAILDYAAEYNRTHAEKLRGLQYDIEPYLLSYYKGSERAVLRNFIALTHAIVGRLEGSDLELSMVIPEFYDGTSDLAPRFFYGPRYAYAFDHLLNALDRRPGSRIIVMAYRSSALGENGSIAIAEGEVAAAVGRKTTIVVAQETAGDLPPHITFHGRPRSYYDEQTRLIERAFANKESFGGLATHYVNTFLTLR